MMCFGEGVCEQIFNMMCERPYFLVCLGDELLDKMCERPFSLSCLLAHGLCVQIFDKSCKDHRKHLAMYKFLHAGTEKHKFPASKFSTKSNAVNVVVNVVINQSGGPVNLVVAGAAPFPANLSLRLFVVSPLEKHLQQCISSASFEQQLNMI